MTAPTIATRLSFRARLQGLMVLGNLGGGVLTFLYFHYMLTQRPSVAAW